MAEVIICIDGIMETVKHFRPPRYEVMIYIRQAIHDAFIEFLGGNGINPNYIQGDINYRADRLYAIAAVVYNNRYRNELYRIECHDPVVTAMKFSDKRRNDRLYCREINTGRGKDVIICEIHRGKKDQKNKHKEDNIIKKAGEYEFELFT